MSIGLLLILAPALFLTAFISGIFGVAGGVILMGVLLSLFAVADAMVLHGIAQTASNGWRVMLHFSNIQWRVIFYYVLGAAMALLVFAWINLVLETRYVFIFLGLVVLAALNLPKGLQLNIERAPHALLCGVSTTAIHLVAGVVGPLLDVFYVHATLNRHQIVATKAMTQTISHIIKIIYFTSLVGVGLTIGFDFWVYGMIVALAFLGALAGRAILDRFTEQGFQKGVRILLIVIGVFYLGRGLQLLFIG